MEAVGKAGFKGVCKVGMDVAALEFKVEGEDCYDLGTRYAEAGKKPDLKMTGAALADFYAGLCKGYPLIVALPALCGPRGERPAWIPWLCSPSIATGREARDSETRAARGWPPSAGRRVEPPLPGGSAGRLQRRRRMDMKKVGQVAVGTSAQKCITGDGLRRSAGCRKWAKAGPVKEFS